MLHFVSRTAMDIRNFGPSILRLVLDEGLVETIADIYTLTVDQLSKLQRMGEKSAMRVVEAIEASKHNSLDQLIHGLGIRKECV